MKNDKKPAIAETQKKHETQKFSDSEEFSDSVVARKRVEELEDQLKRTLADYQNLEKRAAAERSEWVRRANKELILRLLPVLDTLMLAAKHLNDQGLNLSVQQFLDMLANEGVEQIDTVGKAFDPKLMECVETQGGEEGRVLSEIRPGYLFNKEVLRVAQVKVGKRVKEEKEEMLAKEQLRKGDYM